MASLEKLQVRRNKGTKDSFPSASHQLLTVCNSKWAPADHNGLDIISFLNRGDPVAVAAGNAMSDIVFAALKPADSSAANRLAYTILTMMFDDRSPASNIILASSKNGTIVIGQGLALYAALHREFARSNRTTLDVSAKTRLLAGFKMRSKESSSSYILRFEDLVSTLALKNPPQVFPEILRMQWLCKGLTPRYKEVAFKHDRDEYADMDALCAAIRHEEDLQDLAGNFGDEDHDESSVAAIADTKAPSKPKRGKKGKNGNAPNEPKDSNTDTAAVTEDQAALKGQGGRKGGKGADSKQCWICYQYGHIARYCPTVQVKGKGKGRGGGWTPRPKVWCPFHQLMVSHTQDECYLNPYGKGRQGPHFSSSYPSSYAYKGGKGRSRGGGYGRGLAARGDACDMPDYDFSDVDYSTTDYAASY